MTPVNRSPQSTLALGQTRAPAVNSSSLLASRASKPAGGKTFTRAAASSMASGKPSRRRQIWTTASAFCVVRGNPALQRLRAGRRARWTENRVAALAKGPHRVPGAAVVARKIHARHRRGEWSGWSPWPSRRDKSRESLKDPVPRPPHARNCPGPAACGPDRPSVL